MKSRIYVLLAIAFFIMTAFQLIKTTLHITVRDELGNTVKGASVQLFESEDDYNKEQNVSAQGVTDEKGILKLKELKPAPYYVIVRKEDKDNSGGAEKTPKLEEKKVNKVTIIIQ
jgi:hypothetical protein